MVNDIKGIRIRDSVTRNEMALCCYLCALLSKYDISIHALAAERKSRQACYQRPALRPLYSV